MVKRLLILAIFCLLTLALALPSQAVTVQAQDPTLAYLDSQKQQRQGELALTRQAQAAEAARVQQTRAAVAVLTAEAVSATANALSVRSTANAISAQATSTAISAQATDDRRRENAAQTAIASEAQKKAQEATAIVKVAQASATAQAIARQAQAEQNAQNERTAGIVLLLIIAPALAVASIRALRRVTARPVVVLQPAAEAGPALSPQTIDITPPTQGARFVPDIPETQVIFSQQAAEYVRGALELQREVE